MATADRTATTDPQLEELMRRARQVSFYQALLTLERMYGGGTPLGYEGPATDERIRIRPSVSLAHPVADLESIGYSADGQRIEVTATFLGLYGVDSPLPTSFSEHVASISMEERGERVRAFIDIFHHRLYSLLYRAWKKSRPVSGDERTVDPIYDRALALIGYSRRLGFGGEELPRLREARLKVLRTRTAAGLRAMLGYRLGYRCEVTQLQRRWVQVPRDQRSRLGQHNCELGATALLGRRICDRNKIALRVRARDLAMWVDLLPQGPERARLDQSVASYLRDPIDYDVHVELAAEHVPPCRLGNPAHQLGRTAWLGRPRPIAHRCWSGRPGKLT